MKTTQKHNDIINFVKQQPRSKTEIIEQFKSWYPWGCASKYIPVQLNALVKHRLLYVENEVYKIAFLEFN